MTITPSGGDDTPHILAAGYSGEEIGPGNFLLATPLSGIGSGFHLRGRGKRISNFWVPGGHSAFSSHSAATCLSIEDISFIAQGGGASAGQLWGQPSGSNPADVSGYLSQLDIRKCEFIAFAGELDIRYCMAGLRAIDNDWNAGTNGLYTFDCGEQKIRGNRFNSMAGFHIRAEGPAQGPQGTDHSAEDSAFTDNTGNGGGLDGLELINLGFFTVLGNDFTALGRNGLRLSGTCSDGSVVGNIWGSLHGVNHAICLDNSAPQPRGPHHNIILSSNHGDGSYCGAVLTGTKITYSFNHHTANSNVDILAIGLVDSDIVYNTCDSTEFSGGSAQVSIFEAGGSNNRISSNWIRKPVAQGGSGSDYSGNRFLS